MSTVPLVMAGLDPAICPHRQRVDGRVKPGHDDNP
jgi:hypothetical protein